MCSDPLVLVVYIGGEKLPSDTVDGRNPAPVEVGSLSHHLQGFIHPKWCRISSINSMGFNNKPSL